MELVVAALALVTGLLAGAAFAVVQVPIPAPPELPGVLGIVGIFVGYRVVDWTNVGVDLLGRLGLG